MRALLIVLLFVCIVWLNALPYDNTYGPRYAEDWLLMSDEDGNPYYLNFTHMPNESETRSSYLGETYFYLYTRRNTEPELLTISDDKTTTSEYFNQTNPLKVITHGWLSSGDTDWIHDMTSAYLRAGDVNVIAVDWSEMSKNPIYPLSALCTKRVGKRVAEMLDSISRSYEYPGERMHLIGHSLGAQVMGFAGSYSNDEIGRITGLDPARPLFEAPPAGAARRLDASDARFVDVVHSCGGVLGYRRSHGHADYYPNNGRAMQPGCDGLQYIIEACSHGRSHEYFVESIESRGFLAYPCDSWDSYRAGNCTERASLMGEHAHRGARGDHYLATNSEYKYAKGDSTDSS